MAFHLKPMRRRTDQNPIKKRELGTMKNQITA